MHGDVVDPVKCMKMAEVAVMKKTFRHCPHENFLLLLVENKKEKKKKRVLSQDNTSTT